MKKYYKWSLIVVGVLIVIFIGLQLLRMQTKSHSPEATATYDDGNVEITVNYCRPYKKGREIFGGLEPYGEIWRTGANEATVFETSRDLSIDGKTLPAGKYTFYTIPGADTWQVIWNTKEYGWGLNFDGTSPFEREFDILVVEAPVTYLPEVVEQFTITIGQVKGLTLAWDQTEVSVPLGL